MKIFILFLVWGIALAYTPDDKARYDAAIAKAKIDRNVLVSTECKKLKQKEQTECIKRLDAYLREIEIGFRQHYLEQK